MQVPTGVLNEYAFGGKCRTLNASNAIDNDGIYDGRTNRESIVAEDHE